MHKKSIASQDEIYCKFEEIYCQFEEIYCQLKEKYWKFEAKYYDFEVKCTRNLLPAMMKYIARLKLHQKYIAFSKKFPYRIHVLKKYFGQPCEDLTVKKS